MSKIKDAYFRFARAHFSMVYLKDNLLQVVADKIISRYEN